MIANLRLGRGVVTETAKTCILVSRWMNVGDVFNDFLKGLALQVRKSGAGSAFPVNNIVFLYTSGRFPYMSTFFL
jgi:hypothetical protein